MRRVRQLCRPVSRLGCSPLQLLHLLPPKNPPLLKLTELTKINFCLQTSHSRVLSWCAALLARGIALTSAADGQHTSSRPSVAHPLVQKRRASARLFTSAHLFAPKRHAPPYLLAHKCCTSAHLCTSANLFTSAHLLAPKRRVGKQCTPRGHTTRARLARRGIYAEQK